MQGVVVAAEPLPASFAALQANVQKHRDWCHCQGVPCGTIEAVNTGVADGRSIMATFTLYERAAGGLTAFLCTSLPSAVTAVSAFPWPHHAL